MIDHPSQDDLTAGGLPRRLAFYSGGFLWQRRVRRILELAGHELLPLRAGAADGVVVWGGSPRAHRGETVAAARGLPLLRVEDAFLRSIHPGRRGEPPLGLMLDGLGVHFDAAAPSMLERLLASHPLDDTDLLRRARDGIARLRGGHLSKYNAFLPDDPVPPAGYVLVVDQTRGDASVRQGGATAATFAEMLTAARLDHPRARIVIRSHPETALGLRPGHYGPQDCDDRTTIFSAPASPHHLLDGAVAVYSVSSQLGFEAILAGHRPQVFGQPFYAGWGLTEDRQPVPRRRRKLTPSQLFAAAMILAPVWYDPCRDRLCRFEEALDQLEAEVRAWREDRAGHIATGMRLWKRPALQAFFGRHTALRFVAAPERAARLAARRQRPLLIWAGQEPPDFAPEGPSRRVEDGFLRSRGLGAALVPPQSLVADDLGIYYDPQRESRLERLILSPLPAGGAERAERLIRRLTEAGLSKYNLGTPPEDLPAGHRILVPGQVEDDASIRLGCGRLRSNRALLEAVRSANPAAVILYKPHPDVEAGLRPGALEAQAVLAEGLADRVVTGADPAALITACAEVWTLTSLLGFEALLRGCPVTCLGVPFYAGWGLTRDLGGDHGLPVPERRRRAPDGHPLPRPTLLHLAHAALIGYPRYLDPVSRLPCPPEVVVERLASGLPPDRSAANRLLAKLQGAFASQSWLWRRQ